MLDSDQKSSNRRSNLTSRSLIDVQYFDILIDVKRDIIYVLLKRRQIDNWTYIYTCPCFVGFNIMRPKCQIIYAYSPFIVFFSPKLVTCIYVYFTLYEILV